MPDLTMPAYGLIVCAKHQSDLST